jgi:dihydroneopterin aldolase
MTQFFDAKASPAVAGEEVNGLAEEGRDTILIEGLVLPVEIGVLESERGRRQTVRFDVEIGTVPGYRRIVRDTGSYVSYADTVEFIQERAQSCGHVDLVEEWAEAVAEFVLANPLAERVTVKVSKPEIFADAEGVGIRIARRRALPS